MADWLESLHNLLKTHSVCLSTIITSLLTSSDCNIHAQTMKNDLLSSSSVVLSAFNLYPGTREWIAHTAYKVYTQELHALTRKENGWHFSAIHAEANQIEDFMLDDMVTQMEVLAPSLWHLLSALVTQKPSAKHNYGGSELDEEEEKYWRKLDGLEDENLIARSRRNNEPIPTQQRATPRVIERRRTKILQTVSPMKYT